MVLAARSWWPGPRFAAVLAGSVLAGTGLLSTGCGPASHPAAAVTPHRAASSAKPASSAARPAAAGSARPSGATSAVPAGGPTVLPAPLPPGNLHQTRARPSAGGRVFHAEMTDLWAAVVTGQARLAVQAFFPLAAYTQVKAIADPAADWHSRLFGDFRLDVAAAHHYLGRGAPGARLLRVIVPSAEAAWINPGVCYNSVGYWHVAGARLVYREHGQVRSIGIASLISWRGRWYVVHFGAVLRAGATGLVDQPAAGPGVPGPAGGC
jgi:hypothetical protein